MIAALAPLLGACAAAAPVDALIGRAAALVQSERGQEAAVVRQAERGLQALDGEAAKLDYTAVGPLAEAAGDGARPLKLRLWLVGYLQALRDPAAFAPLKRLALDESQPDLLREAALRALALAPVGDRAKRLALCAALDAGPGPQTLAQALLELETLGCEDVGALEKQAAPRAAHADRALTALGRSQPPAALDALDRLLSRYARGSAERLAALEALRARVPQLALEPARWARRVAELAHEEARQPRNAVCALRLLAAIAEPSSAAEAARFLRSADGDVVVAAAETLAALRAKDRRAEVERVYERFHEDERFAGPGRDAVALYERLGAALEKLR